MQYYSTNHQAPKVTLKEAIMHSGAPDGGLYMPDRIPQLPQAIFNNIAEMSISEISYFVANTLFGTDLPSAELKKIGDSAFNFPIPLVEIEPGIYALELFHGPTMTVKDIGSRFLARMLFALHPSHDKPLNVLVATNGNSGSAVANGFYGIDGINIFALYPKGSPRHRVSQFSTLGGNVHAICVNGTIDNCREMVMSAIGDEKLGEMIKFTCANTVNIGRVLPKSMLYFLAYAQLKQKDSKADNIHISVPCGNGGNLLAGLTAKKMGLPITKLIAAGNANAPFSHFIEHRSMEGLKRTSRTLAYAMDTATLANAPRFADLCGGDLAKLRAVVADGRCDDEAIRHTIRDVYKRTGYMLDPHSAVAYKCLKDQLPAGATGIVFATAAPGRSSGLLSTILGHEIELPEQLKRYLKQKSQEVAMPPTYPALRKYLLQMQ